jgi:hypothetical protein
MLDIFKVHPRTCTPYIKSKLSNLLLGKNEALKQFTLCCSAETPLFCCVGEKISAVARRELGAVCSARFQGFLM